MDLWVRNEATMFHSVVMTIVGRDNNARIELTGHLRDGDHQHMVVRHSQSCDWSEPQESGTDWLRETLIELVERL